MSEIRVNTIVAAEGTSAPRLPYGVSVPTGMGITGAGGVNITGVVTAANIDGTLTAGSAVNSTGVSTIGRLEVSKDINVGAAVTIAGIVDLNSTTDSTSASTGALLIAGGVGIAKNVYIGAGLSIAGTLTYEDVTNVDSVGVGTFGKGVDVTAGGIDITAGGIDVTGVGTFSTNISVGGEVAAASLDISGNADIDGTMEADAYTVNGTALDTHIAGVTVTNATNATNATNSTNSTHVYVTDNESTNENNLITFVEDATSSTGNVGLEMDGNLTYNPSTGTVSATSFSGNLSGTLQTAAQTNVTSVGSLTGLTVTGDFTLDNGSNAGNDVVWDASSDTFRFEDGVLARWGDSDDFQIYHNGSNTLMEQTGTGSLYIRPKSGEDGIILNPDGAITIAYDNSTKIATTNNGVVVTGIMTATTGANFDGILSEKFNTVAGKLSDNTTIDLEDGMIHYFTTTETTTSTPNIRFSSSQTLNNTLSTGDSLTVTVITTAAAAGYSANWQVDGSAVTEQWNGGSAPSAGGADGYDVYTVTLLKTASATFTVFANVSNFT